MELVAESEDPSRLRQRPLSPKAIRTDGRGYGECVRWGKAGRRRAAVLRPYRIPTTPELLLLSPGLGLPCLMCQQSSPCGYWNLDYLKLHKNWKFSFLVALATSQMLNSHMWSVATILDSRDTEHLHHHGKFYWTLLGSYSVLGSL